MPYPNALAGLFGLPDNNAQPDTSGGLFGAAKRQVTGLLSDPVGNAKQTLGLLGQQISRQNALMDAAFSDRTNPLQITNRNALAEAANNMLTGPLGFAPVGMVVHHGSPHQFDSFRSGKMGTGEGNSVFGPGTYLAENPQVAAEYMRAGRNLGPSNWDQPKVLADKAFAQARGDADQALRLLDNWAAQTPGEAMKANLESAKGVLREGGQKASLYKVDLPDEHVAKMLDWDMPIAQQPAAVRSLLDSLGIQSSGNGKDAFAAIGNASTRKYGMSPFASQQAAARALHEAGVPGLRYLDGGSREVGRGTSNFVVFPGNEGLLKILERNGQAIR